MVPLIERSTYVENLRQNPKLNLFYSLVNNLPIPENFDTSINTDEIIYDAFKAFRGNKKDQFERVLATLTIREPSSNSPFTNDDILLYIIICCIVRFKEDDSWIRKVLKVRIANDEESQTIKTTFQNLIDQNYVHSANACQMIVPFESFLNQPLISVSQKKCHYTALVTKKFPAHRSDFLNILSLRSFDLMLFENDPSDRGSIFRYKTFEQRFLYRVSIVAKILFAGALIIATYYILLYCFNPKNADTAGKISLTLTLIGFGSFSFFKREWVLRLIEKTIQDFWGYKS